MLFISRIFSLFSLPKVSIPGNQVLYISNVTAGLQVRIRWILDPDSENQMMTSLCILSLIGISFWLFYNVKNSKILFMRKMKKYKNRKLWRWPFSGFWIRIHNPAYIFGFAGGSWSRILSMAAGGGGGVGTENRALANKGEVKTEFFLEGWNFSLARKAEESRPSGLSPFSLVVRRMAGIKKRGILGTLQ